MRAAGGPDPRRSPEPIAALRARTHDAIVDLAAIRSTDPAASEAIHAARLAAHTLESWWVPALDRALGKQTDP